MENAIMWCVIIVSGMIAVYFYAEVRSHKRFILKQEEWIKSLKEENRDLLNKVLVKHGQGVLGRETAAPRPPVNANPKPQVRTRAELQRRAAEEPQTTPIDISATGVSAPPRKGIVDKARSIFE